jgi:hypothetical protein
VPASGSPDVVFSYKNTSYEIVLEGLVV